MTVAIARTLLDGLLAAERLSPEQEICGLLFGDQARIAAARPTLNVASDPARHFEIDPAALIAALREERGGGPGLIGHYHSHPGGSAVPSPRDLAAAEPGRLWLILAAGTARLWLAEAGSFSEVKMVVDDPVPEVQSAAPPVPDIATGDAR